MKAYFTKSIMYGAKQQLMVENMNGLVRHYLTRLSEEKQMLFKVHSYGRILAEAALS